MRVYREPTWRIDALTNGCAPRPRPLNHRYVAAAAPCTCGTLGSRLPDLMPATMLTLSLASVEVSVERSLPLLRLALSEKSKCSLGVAPNSSSIPELCAFGTLKTRRDVQVPAVTVSCRSLISI